jgi:hypothetical protein
LYCSPNINSGDRIKEDEMGRACGMERGEKKFMQRCGGKAEEIT